LGVARHYVAICRHGHGTVSGTGITVQLNARQGDKDLPVSVPEGTGPDGEKWKEETETMG